MTLLSTNLFSAAQAGQKICMQEGKEDFTKKRKKKKQKDFRTGSVTTVGFLTSSRLKTQLHVVILLWVGCRHCSFTGRAYEVHC